MSSSRPQTNWKNRGAEEEQPHDCNWDDPLPTSTTATNEEEQTELSDELERRANLEKLDAYVCQMAYVPAPPPPPLTNFPRTEKMAQPRGFILMDNSERYGEFQQPRERAERMATMASTFQTVPPE